MDLASGNQGSLDLFFQEQTKEFRRAPLTQHVPDDIWAMAAGDIDGDGFLDLATAASSQSQFLSVFFQKSPGVFEGPPDLSMGGANENPGLALLDIEGDGDVDFLSCKNLPSLVILFVQDAPESFRQIALGSVEDTPFPTTVSAGDLDGDGDPDLVAGGSSTLNPRALAVFFQRGLGAFPRKADLRLLGANHPNGFLLLDLDGDGDPDIASGSFGAPQLSLFFGSRH